MKPMSFEVCLVFMDEKTGLEHLMELGLTPKFIQTLTLPVNRKPETQYIWHV